MEDTFYRKKSQTRVANNGILFSDVLNFAYRKVQLVLNSNQCKINNN